MLLWVHIPVATEGAYSSTTLLRCKLYLTWKQFELWQNQRVLRPEALCVLLWPSVWVLLSPYAEGAKPHTHTHTVTLFSSSLLIRNDHWRFKLVMARKTISYGNVCFSVSSKQAGVSQPDRQCSLLCTVFKIACFLTHRSKWTSSVQCKDTLLYNCLFYLCLVFYFIFFPCT